MAKEAADPPTSSTSSNQPGSGLPSGNLVVKCNRCKEILISREWEKNLKVCPRCNYHFKLSAYERIELLTDQDSFVEIDANIISTDPLHFVARTRDDVQEYAKKLSEERKKVNMNEGVVTGHATIDGMPLALAVMDFRFIGGSMGSAVGEKITRIAELGLQRRIPVKISAALAKLGEAGVPYISLLTDPTTGGVTASFAMQGDVILAEPGALICFTGPRVIEQFMHVKLPEGTVNSEFVLQHGMIDAVIQRRDLRHTLARLISLYMPGNGQDNAQFKR